MLAAGNWNGFYAGARGLLETICSATWALQNVERLPSFVRQEQIKPEKMLNAGYSKWPYLKELYSELSAIVHPARDGHLLGSNSGGLEGTGIMTSFSDYFFNRKLNTLRTLLLQFAAEIRELVNQKEDSIRVGKVMAELRPHMEA